MSDHSPDNSARIASATTSDTEDNRKAPVAASSSKKNVAHRCLHATALKIERPGRFDVVFGRGKSYQQHPGNQRMRLVVEMHKARYDATTTRKEKTDITQEIVRIVQTSGEPPGRFIKEDGESGGWEEVDDEVSRIKVSTSLRYKAKSSGASASRTPAVVSTESPFQHEQLQDSNARASQEEEAKATQSGNSIPLLSNHAMLFKLDCDPPGKPKQS